MQYGKSMKNNFYTNGKSEIAMPPLGEVSPVLADSPELQGTPEVEKPVVESQVEEVQDVVQHEESDESSDQDQEVSQEEVSQQAPKAKQDHPNFKSLREARERAEWERDTLKQQIMQMQQNQYQQGKPQASVEEPDEDDISFDVADDSLLEGKHAKQLVNELKKVKKELRQFHSQSSEVALEAKIKANFPDFISVVSPENVQTLNDQFPEIAQSLRDTPNIYNKAAAAYSIMKRFGIHKDRTYEEDKMKAVKNAQKPRPVASVNPQQGDSPLSKANAFANGLTEDLRKQMLKEMTEARKNM